jgi:beta-lactamase regulating signal transducer with metallopeptidase domain/tetratricopeptide (TPR) repeat protein
MEMNLANAIRFALDIALKATVLLLATGIALAALKRASASTRQLVATLGLAGTLLLPAITLVAPRWEIPLVPNPVPVPSRESAMHPTEEWAPPADPNAAFIRDERLAASEPVSSPPEETNEVSTAPLPAAPEAIPGRSPISRTTGMLLILAGWVAGMVFSLARLEFGAARIRRVCRLASPDADGEWAGIVADLSQKLGLSRPIRLLFSEDLAVPVTTGVSRPIVLLPETARRWNEERRRVVLLHELAHVKRADWVALVIGQIAAAVYWFHPLVWSVRIQMRRDCERACDDLVLASGTRASVYAAHLLSIIRSLRLSQQRALPAVAMARRSYWDGRMRAILDPDVKRRVVSPAQARLAGAMLVAAVVVLAAFEPWSAREAEAVAPDSVGFSATADSTPADAVVAPPTDVPCDEGKKAPEAEPAVAPDAAEATEAPEPPIDANAITEAVAPEAESPETRSDETITPETPESPQPPASGYVPVSKRKNHGGSWYQRGMELHNEERYDDAIAAFQKSIEEGEKVEAATYNIGCGYARKGDSAKAFEWLQKAIDEGFDADHYLAKDDDLDSLRSDPRFAQLRRAAKENETAGSRAQAERIAARYGRLKTTPAARGKAFYEIGKDLLEVGRYDLAAQAFETSAARAYKEGASLYNTACALSLRGDRARALDYLEKSLVAGFDDVGLFRQDDDLDNVRGEPRYRELLKMAQDLELHRFEWGSMKSWTRAGRRNAWRETEQHFAQYVQSHPRSGRAWSNLGYARIEGERAEVAAEAFQRALELRYRMPTTMYNLACAYSLMDRKDEAFAWLFKSLDAGFDASGTLRGDDDLDNLRGDPRFRQAQARLKNHDGDDRSD